MNDAMRRLLSLCLLGSWAFAGDSSLASLLPGDTPVYFEIRSPTPKEMETLAMARVFEDPRMKALLGRAQGDGNSLSSMRLPLGESLLSIRTDLLAVDSMLADVSLLEPTGERTFRVKDRVAFALTDIVAGEMPIELVAGFHVDGDARAAAATVERIAAAASLASRDEADAGIDEEIARLIHRAEHKGLPYSWADVGPVRICLAAVGSMVVVATSEQRMKDILERGAGTGEGSLAEDPRTKEILASVPGTGTPTTQIALHIDRALAKFALAYPQMGAMAQHWLAQIGLKDLESITTVGRVAGEGVRASTCFRLAAADRRFGLGRLFSKGGAPPKYGGLAYAPEDSLYVSCGNIDVPGLWDMIRELGGIQFMMAVAGPIEREFGLKPREDLVNLLGPEFTLIVAPNRGLLPDVALVCESADAGRLERNLLQILSRLKWPAGTGVTDFKMRDVTVHSVPLGHPAFGNVPICPTFGVVDGRLVIAPFPLTFQRVLAVKRGDRPTIEKNPEFMKLRAAVPAGADGLSYLDLVRLFDIAYDTFLPLVQSLSGGASPPPLYELPEVDTLSRHLFGRVAWRIADERGLRWESYSSVDTSSFTLSFVAGAGMGLYILRAPEGAASKEAAGGGIEIGVRVTGEDADVCRHHVRNLRARLQLYRKEKGRLPDRLEELETKWLEPENFVVPGCGDARYVYLGPKGQGLVLLHGMANGADGLVTVLKTNLKIDRVSAQELERLKAAKAAR